MRRARSAPGVDPGPFWVLWTTVFWKMPRSGFYDYFDRIQSVVVTVCYAPLLAWGPLLACVAVAYLRRRMAESPNA